MRRRLPLRLGETHALTNRGREASLRGALDILVGETPVQKRKAQDPTTYMDGEKVWRCHWKIYKPVAHALAALGSLGTLSPMDLKEGQIESFLRRTVWFRCELLRLGTPNVKDKCFMNENELLPLPSWVQPTEDMTLEPLEEKLASWQKKVDAAKLRSRSRAPS